jgi:heme/copper-type cytochrome/quinol oxidase subunit 2
MEYAVEMTSYGMMYLPSIMKIGMGVQTLVRFCLRNWRSCNDHVSHGKNYEYDVEMGSGVIIYIPSLIKIGLGILKLLVVNTHADTQRTR